MKINAVGNASTIPAQERDPGARVEHAGGRFSADLLKSQDKLSADKLGGLLEDITAQGKKLSNTPTYAELKNYRELVRSFLAEAVGRMYILQSQGGWDRHGRQKMYTVIKEIDIKLAELTEDVRHGQSRQLAIMEKLDAIRGMLVDLYT